MSKCDDLFQQRQSLLAEQKKNNEDIARIESIRASVDFPEESRWQDIRDKLAKYMEDQQAAKRIREAMDDPKKKGYSSIPTDQPLNFVQKMRDYPDEMVVDMANVAQAFLKAGKEGTPEQYAFLKADPYEAAKHISSTMNTARTPTEVLNMLSDLQAVPNSTQDLLEKTLRARWFNEKGREAFIDTFYEIENFMEANPNKEVPMEMLEKMWNTEKIAFWSESAYDFYRNQWHKQGKAMQGDMFSDDVLELMDDAKAVNPDNYPDPVSYANSLGILDKTLDDVSPETDATARVWQAAADNVTRPKEAAEQLALEIANIKIQGVDPQKRRPVGRKEIRNKKLRITNLLAKDHQLFNLRTLGLAVQSNSVMAIYGPYHTFLRNSIYRPYGTSLQEGIFEAFEANWKGLRQGFKALKEGGIATMNDTYKGKSSFFASNVETYGKFNDSVLERKQDLEFLLSPDKPSEMKDTIQWAVNPERAFRYTHAAHRLWLYKKTGNPMTLRPGFTALSAADGPAGLFYTNFKLRTEYEMKARREGVQRELKEALNREPNQKDIDNWVNERMEEAFYKEDPTEAQIQAYRKEQNIPEGVMSDDAVADEIVETRVRDGYSGPVPLMDDDVVREASEFSARNRFQSVPQEGNWLKDSYEFINKTRRNNPYADIAVPYLQAPVAGVSLDGRLIGAGNVNDWVTGRLKGMTRKQRAGAMADLIITSQVWGLFLLAESQGQIIGNGPIDQKERAMWRADLKRQGKRPNTIYGIPLVGGLPVASVMFLLHDAHEAWDLQARSKHDDIHFTDAIWTVLVGHIQRNTGVGQLGQLMEIFTNADFNVANPVSKARSLAGYIGAGRTPGIGLTRQAERVTDSSKYNFYRDSDVKSYDAELFTEEQTSKAMQYIKDVVALGRNAGFDVTGLTGVLPGGRRKNKDWLGTRISYPWGTRLKDFIFNRHEPALHPKDKVYAELKQLGLLIAPPVLYDKKLDGVPMDDDMQDLYNEIYGSIGPGLQPIDGKIVDKLPSEAMEKQTFKYAKYDDSDLDFKYTDGEYVKDRSDFQEIDLLEIMDEHVIDSSGKGRKFIDAARSIINSPRYQKYQNNPNTTTDFGVADHPPHVREEQYAMKIMRSLRRYYGILAADSFRMSDHPAADIYRNFKNNKQVKTNLEADLSGESVEGIEDSL